MFQCNKCGICCRNLNLSPIYADLDDGTGVCRYLKDNLCTIYPDQPVLCLVDECYVLNFKSLMLKDNYYKLNYVVCNQLKQIGD